MGRMLTGHFSESEMRCKCGCGEMVADPELMEGLEKARVNIGLAMIISSGYRCPKANAACGGAAGSAHMFGKAADVFCPGASIEELYRRIEKCLPGYFNGIGTYPDEHFLHLDVLDRYNRWVKIAGVYRYLFQEGQK